VPTCRQPIGSAKAHGGREGEEGKEGEEGDRTGTACSFAATAQASYQTLQMHMQLSPLLQQANCSSSTSNLHGTVETDIMVRFVVVCSQDSSTNRCEAASAPCTWDLLRLALLLQEKDPGKEKKEKKEKEKSDSKDSKEKKEKKVCEQHFGICTAA
jgi:hypothetical protein